MPRLTVNGNFSLKIKVSSQIENSKLKKKYNKIVQKINLKKNLPENENSSGLYTLCIIRALLNRISIAGFCRVQLLQEESILH